MNFENKKNKTKRNIQLEGLDYGDVLRYHEKTTRSTSDTYYVYIPMPTSVTSPKTSANMFEKVSQRLSTLFFL